MTTRELLTWIGESSWLVPVYCIGTPLLAWLCRFAHPRGGGGRGPWRFVYAALVYLACVPGVFAAVITAYSLLFVRENLLDVNPLIYFGPIAGMIATLVVIGQVVETRRLPGVDRLSAFITLLAVSFFAIFFVSRLFVGLLFFANIWHLLIIALVVFVVLKVATGGLLRTRSGGADGALKETTYLAPPPAPKQ